MGGLDADQAARRQNSYSRRDFLKHELCGTSRGRRSKADSLCRGSWARANHRRIGLRIWNFRRLRSGFSRFLVDEAAVTGGRRANRVEEVVGPRELVLATSVFREPISGHFSTNFLSRPSAWSQRLEIASRH